jgi:hypothetical protein
MNLRVVMKVNAAIREIRSQVLSGEEDADPPVSGRVSGGGS